ncbi:hypothetical protein ILUMI_03800 [Ignelater luminosus]|uniref:Ig-like domain-containing protein n=1 Tax=Ignelater luminosus TaxID=2038154 RepID=A0A8K0GJL0_IGNLU|nr:hypothetical protein ILUMI_03800 [Ignelater luminosus]
MHMVGYDLDAGSPKEAEGVQRKKEGWRWSLVEADRNSWWQSQNSGHNLTNASAQDGTAGPESLRYSKRRNCSVDESIIPYFDHHVTEQLIKESPLGSGLSYAILSEEERGFFQNKTNGRLKIVGWNSNAVIQPPVAPVCRDSEISVIGASLDEVIRVRCHVAADPSDVTFVWQFNNSGESFDVSPARFTTTSGNMSELKYTPASQRDYGTLTCWGQNPIGRQSEPCVFQIVPAAKPSPLSNCTLRTATNHSSDALEVECRAGYDGGLPQRFILEAYDSYTMRLRFNLSSTNNDVPFFRFELAELLTSNGEGIPPSLRVVVYAENAKGRSEKVVLEDITLNDAEKRTG